ncbi:MAG: nucleotidyltransferase [Pirellulales bacterium]
MNQFINREQLLESIIDELDIPKSYYQKAIDRACSLEDWLLRENSTVASLRPEVYPQGSFRYGTVIRPIHDDAYYDLDLVCTFDLSKTDVTQAQVKLLLGMEIQAYAKAMCFKEEASEKPRCWRLNYADEVSFHMDILPGIPNGTDSINERLKLMVPIAFAEHEIAITDSRHKNFNVLSLDWPSSNPRGYARWFEAKTRPYAKRRLERLVENRTYASVEEIPPYEWKTVLQRVIQIFKRHRDVRFKDDATFAPISMIITTLATHAYEGQSEISDAIKGIAFRMPSFIKTQKPRIPNPVNPNEDFADRWSSDPAYERAFRLWHMQLVADIDRLLTQVEGQQLQESISKSFKVQVEDEVVAVSRPSHGPAVRVSTPAPLIIPSAPRPWGTR